MLFDPFAHRHVPNWQPPQNREVKCAACGLRFVQYHQLRPHGSGLCRYCEAAQRRQEQRHGMV